MPLVCVCPRLVRPNVGRNPFRVHLVPLATKHHIPPHNAYSLRGACALSCLVCCDVKNKTLAKSLRSGAEHTTSGSTPPPHRPRQATRSLRRRSTSPILPDAEDALPAPRPRVPPHRVHQPILPQRISSTACPFPPLLSYLVPVHPPRPASAFLSSVTVCVRAARVSILRVRLRGAPLPLPQARAARARFPSCLPAPLRAARTKQDPDTCARTRGELGGGGGACKGEEMSHGQELGHGAWPSGWRRSLRNGW